MMLQIALRSMRLPFLTLAPVCVFLGLSSAVASHGNVDWGLFALVLTGALLSHIAVNSLNEYQDFKSGLDLTTIKTPFSGGSGALPSHPEMAGVVGSVGIVSLLGALMLGVLFIAQGRLLLIPFGIVGLVLILTYTEWINRRPLLCLIAPGLGFGFLMVVGSQVALMGEHSLLPWLAASVPFFLTNNLLLLNQYPDITADAKVGRNHFPIAHGTQKSSLVYGLFVAVTIVLILSCVSMAQFPNWCLLALLPMPLAFFSLSGAYKHGERIGEHPKYLAANVAVALLCPLLLGIGLMTG